MVLTTDNRCKEETVGHYKHLTPEEREDIMCLYREGTSLRQIAQTLDRAPSTISRELRRNFCGFYYRASTAQKRYEARRCACKKPHLLDDPQRRELVTDLVLTNQWSPEQLSGRIELEHPELSISATTIYRAIWAGELDVCIGSKKASRRLRRKGRRRSRKTEELRGKIKISHEIDERPLAADKRERIGDWEADTVAGKAQGACIVTLVDRKRGHLVGGKARTRRKTEVRKVMERSVYKQPLHTVTLDLGKEFAEHALFSEKFNAECYFCLPSHPWQRGTSENTNGLLREYFPKGRSLDDVSEEQMQQAFDKLNLRPRKRLDWKCPYEVYHSETLHLL